MILAQESSLACHGIEQQRFGPFQIPDGFFAAAAGFDNDGQTTSNDLFAFLDAYFLGC